jgi:hypothetical protein
MHRRKGRTKLRSLQRTLLPDMKDWTHEANLPCQGLANKAAQAKTYRFRNLFGVLTVGFLLWCWDFINRRASAGVDKLDAIAYEDNLIGNIQQLAQQVKEGTYRAKLVLRKTIPKTGGKLRPLGIPAIADKLLQLAVAKVLEAIGAPRLPALQLWIPASIRRSSSHQGLNQRTEVEKVSCCCRS